MLGLVATGVHAAYLLRHYTNLQLQLFAAIHEWRTGEHTSTDFSADTFMNVYDGHVLTLKTLRTQHPRGFHTLMADLYTLARCVSRFVIMISTDQSSQCECVGPLNNSTCSLIRSVKRSADRQIRCATRIDLGQVNFGMSPSSCFVAD